MPKTISANKQASVKIIKLTADQSQIETFDEFEFAPSKGINFNWEGLAQKLGFNNPTELRKSGVRDLISLPTHSISFDEYSKLLSDSREEENLKMKQFFTDNKEKFVLMFNNQIAFLGVFKDGAKFGTVVLNVPKLEIFKGEKVIDTTHKKTSK